MKKQKGEDLIKIDPKNLIGSADNLFFSLSLIRNDLSDLTYLQGLHAKESRLILSNSDIPMISAEKGRIAGRDIYLFRLLLSHFYGILEFLEQNKELIYKDEELNHRIRLLHGNQQKSWLLFRQLASYKDKGIPQKVKGIKNIDLQVVALACTARNDLTYHYYKTATHIKKGYKLTFETDEKKDHNFFAYVVEIDHIDKNRSHYIDVSIQRYLEQRGEIEGTLIEKMLDPTLQLVADFYSIISLILKDYHISKRTL